MWYNYCSIISPLYNIKWEQVNFTNIDIWKKKGEKKEKYFIVLYLGLLHVYLNIIWILPAYHIVRYYRLWLAVQRAEKYH